MKLCSPAHRRTAALSVLSAQSSMDESSSSLASRSRSVSPLRKHHNSLLIGLSTGMFDANNPKVITASTLCIRVLSCNYLGNDGKNSGGSLSRIVLCFRSMTVLDVTGSSCSWCNAEACGVFLGRISVFFINEGEWNGAGAIIHIVWTCRGPDRTEKTSINLYLSLPSSWTLRSAEPSSTFFISIQRASYNIN